VRDFSDRKVADADLATVLEAARWAPTACNRQPFRLVIVRQRKRLDRLCKAYRGDWLRTAPCIIVAIALPEEAWVRRPDRKNHAEIDLAIAIDHLTLAAADLGLGTCWICAFDPGAVATMLDLPATEVPVALIPLGHPVGSPPADRPRKPLATLTAEDAPAT
jgi:nitroreductase